MDEFGQAHGRVLVPGHTHDSLDQSFDSLLGSACEGYFLRVINLPPVGRHFAMKDFSPVFPI